LGGEQKFTKMTRKLLKYKFPESNFLVIVGNFLENPQAPQGAFYSLYLTLIDYLLVALYTLRALKRRHLKGQSARAVIICYQ
jgi:hypothetical protein